MLDFLSRLFVRMVDSLCWISAIGKCVYALMLPIELTKTASELRKKIEQQKAKKMEQSERIRRERMLIPTGELPTNRSNGIVMTS